MTKLLLLPATFLLAATAIAQTAPPPQPVGPAAEVLASYTRMKGNILKAAEKMPAADYNFKGTPEIRTYARVVNHITEAQQHTCSALNGTAFDAKAVPSDTAGKDAVIAGLKASFDACDKAYSALTDATVTSTITMGPNTRTRIGSAWANVSHDNEQYAILSIYLRLKHLTPPTSEK